MKAQPLVGRKAAVILVHVLALALLLGAVPALAAGVSEPGCNTSIRIGDCDSESGCLPLPCTLRLADYEQLLYSWANQRAYTRLGWQRDKLVRNTGPYVLGANYGIHPAVRIYYSPEVYAWLTTENRQGDLPDGAMIVKEMFNPPAARYEEQRCEICGEGPECTEGCEAYDAFLEKQLSSWTIMIKDRQTTDGWFWSGPTLVERRGKTAAEFEREVAGTLDTNDFPFEFRDSDFGQASCLRCHATAEAESTFASLDNIEGKGLQFRVDNSWRTDLPPEQRPAAGESESTLLESAFHGNSSAATRTPDGRNIVSDPLPEPNPEFLKYFKLGQGAMPPVAAHIKAFPGQWADHVPAGPDGAEQFITSDNCVGCHGGLGGAPFGVNMFLQTGPSYGDGYNISPFGEWRWSPMGLAGRDPAFYSQLVSEIAILDNDFEKYPERFDNDPKVLEEAKTAVVNTCLSCHGAMGQRQLLIDAHAQGGKGDLEPDFKLEYVDAFTPLTKKEENPLNNKFHKYGNLAREGISCAICHHINPPEPEPGQDWTEFETFLMTSTTGQFPYSPPDELNGPFADVQVLPMQQALGITPKENDYIQDSQMCGTCHTINLPNVDCPRPGEPGYEEAIAGDGHRCQVLPRLDESARIQARRLKEQTGATYPEALTPFQHSIEQATFLEWQNSDFGPDMPGFQSCQECHMPNSFHSLDGSIEIDPLSSPIASIQDTTYPEVDHSLPPQDLEIPFRDDYRRHELVGLNAFLLEMFDQFDPILGVAEGDYMTGATTGNRQAIESMLLQAENDTVKLEVEATPSASGKLIADVTVTNLVGHRFPSGVGFRRAWLELLVLDNSRAGKVVWASGRTNGVGLLVDGLGEAKLPTEFFEGNLPQPHFGMDAECELPPDRYSDTCHPPITREDQVQIYEEVVLNGEGDVNFSFIHRDTHLKDNRLLPRGWKGSDEFESDIVRQFMESTDPVGVENDPDYKSVPGFKGQDQLRYVIDLPPGANSENFSVQVKMYYQAFQPYWMQRRFELSGKYPETQRLYFMASHLQTEGTVIEGWKLPLVCAEASVAGGGGSGACG